MKKLFFRFAFLTLLLMAGCLFFEHQVFAAARTWDGGGSTNNWSENANWSLDTKPVAGDTVTFDATSTKNAVIDQAFTIASLSIAAGYTGTVTQSADLTINSTGSFNHLSTDGTFTWSSGTLTFANNVNSTWNVDTDDTFGNVTINKVGAILTVSNGDTAIVTGTLTLTDGNIGTGTVEARGDVTHSSTFDGGTGTLSITQGSTDINLVGSGQLPITTLSAARIINGPSSGTTTFDGRLTLTAGSYVGGAGNLVMTGGITVSGGTFTGGSGNIDNNSSFILSSGTFTSTTGTYFVAGAWTHTAGGTFSPSTGTVTFDGAASTLDVSSTETFNNLTINANAGVAETIASGDTFIVNGTLTLSEGQTNTGTLEVRGELSHGAAYDGGTGSLTITQGSSAINLTDGGQLPATTLSASRTVNGAASGTVTFDGLLTIAGGTFSAGAGDLTLSSGLTVSGGTYTGGSGTHDVNGPFVLSGEGTVFTATTGSMLVQGSWTHTDSSTFTHSNGTVAFDGGTQPTDVNSTETFYNLHLNGTDGLVRTISTGDTLIVTNTLTLTEGLVGTGTLDARGDIVHGANFDGGTGTLSITQGSSAIDLTPGGQLPATTLSADRVINGPASGTVTFDGVFTVSNGSFAGGAGALDLTSLTLTGGTFTAPATMNVSGAWTHTDGGTFAHNSGTVIFDGGNTATHNVNETETFYNLSFAKVTQGSGITAGDTLIALGTLTLTDGTVTTGTLEARGAISQASTFDGGSTFIDFGNDEASQTYTIAGGTTPGIRLDSAADANDVIAFSTAATVTNLTLSSTFSGTAQITNATDAVLTFTTLSVGGGTLDVSSQSNWQIVTLTTSGGTFTPPTLVTITGGNTTWNVNESQTFNNLTIARNSGFTVTFTTGDVFRVTGDLIFQDGRMAIDGAPRAEGDVTFMSTWDGGAPVPTLLLAGAATQTLDLTGATGVHNGGLTIDKSGGQVNLASDLVLDADGRSLTLTEGTLNLAGYNLTVTGNASTLVVSDGGNLMLQGGETITLNSGQPNLATGSTVTYTGNGDAGANTYTVTSLKSTYHHLVINSTDGSTDVFELGSALDINGNLTVSAGTLDVSASNYAMTVAGDWSNSGTFNGRAGTVTFDGTNQAVTGTNTFYNFTKAVSASASLTLPASATQTFLGTLTLTGASASQRLSLVSGTPGTRAKIDPQGARTLDYVSVMDSDNENATLMSCPLTCVDRGNNEGWTLPSTGGGSQPVQIVVPTTIAITRPNIGGIKLTAGTKFNITWGSSGPGISSVSLHLSLDDGLSFTTIADKERNDGSYIWTVPNSPAAKARLMIKGTDGVLTTASDINDRSFAIVSPVIVAPEPTTPPVVAPTEPLPETPTTPPVVEVPVVTPETPPVVSEPDPVTSWPPEAPVLGPIWEPVAGAYVRADNSKGVYYLEQHPELGLVLRPFLSPQVFFTYESSFDAVHVVAASELSSIPVDGIMLPKPGVVLVKLPTNERVYAVESVEGSTFIRWIATEELAVAIYGPEWSDYVIDMDPVTWASFVEGEPITEVITVDTTNLRKRDDLFSAFMQ